MGIKYMPSTPRYDTDTVIIDGLQTVLLSGRGGDGSSKIYVLIVVLMIKNVSVRERRRCTSRISIWIFEYISSNKLD